MLPSELLETTWVGRVPKNLSEHCLVSAFGEFRLWFRAKPILKELIGEEFPHEWNDSHTKTEVIAVARLAEMRLGLRPIETIGTTAITELRNSLEEPVKEVQIHAS